jgi:electron transfer flavoprotein beta subunit
VLTVVVLLSLGRHPASGRARRSSLDARALALALTLPDASVVGVHAGEPDEPALRDYLGQGLGALRALKVPAGHDPVPPLAAELLALRPDLVFAGATAEAGEGSGLVPYLLADALGAELVPSAVNLTVRHGTCEVVQALAGGRRRLVPEVPLPLVATVPAAAPAPAGTVAFARARRGVIHAVACENEPDRRPGPTARRPARRRPAAGGGTRAARAAGGSALDRLRAATETAGEGGGRLLVGPAPEAAAEAILDHLAAIGVADLGSSTAAADGAPEKQEG